MDPVILSLTNYLSHPEGARLQVIEQGQQELGRKLPEDYAAYVAHSNGGSGRIGALSFLQLWPVEKLPARNRPRVVSSDYPELVLFASDGGEIVYALSTQGQVCVYLETPREILSEAKWRVIGHSFKEFLEYVSQQA